VQVFFALSGWLIGGILFRTTPSELSRFFYNRATRIWIPYFFTVSALYLISYLHEPTRSARWSEFLAYDVTFTHNWFTLSPDAQLSLSQMPLRGTGNHFWSLAVEEQFYLIAPLLMVLMPFGKKILPWICVATLAYVSRSEYASISFGVLSAVVAGKYGNWQRKRNYRIAEILGLVVAIVALSHHGLYEFAAPVFAISVVLLCTVPIRRNPVTRWLGGVSFPFYLNAWIGTFAIHAVAKSLGFTPSAVWLPLGFLAALAGAAATFQLIDEPVMAKRNRYYVPRIGWLLGAVGYLLLTAGILFRLHIDKRLG
jgi:peptidoglycan/LPS O-acetylase OafA/YrhL